MFAIKSSRMSRIASAIGLATVVAISALSNRYNAGRPSPGANGASALATTADATTEVARLPEVVVVATRLDPEGPGVAH